MTNYTLGGGIATVDLVTGNFTTLFGEDGTTVLGTIDAKGYSIAQLAIPAGNSNGISAWDSLIGTTGNDIVVWHGRTTSAHGGYTQYSTSSFKGLPDASQTAAIDVIDLGAGDDILNLTFNAGSNSPGAYAWNATVYGGVGNDLLVSGAGNDFLWGGTGGTVIDTTGTDTIFAGAGNDFINGNLGADTLYGGSGNDTILGSEDLDTVYGDAGDDTLFGGADADFVYGSGGNDTLSFLANDGSADAIAAAGTTTSGWDGNTGTAAIVVSIANKSLTLDYRDGGTGFDTLVIANGVLMGSTGAAYLGYSGTTIQLVAVERIVGDATSDIINLTFNNGVTRLAYATDATIVGGDGNDVIFSGSGNDFISGGLDTVSGVANGAADDSIYGGAGNDTVWGDTGGDIAESLGGGNDFIRGGLGDDTIYGGAGIDTIEGDGSGFAGNDTIYGGSGNDAVSANQGNDRVFGDSGDDNISGDVGDDTVDGGAGNDTVFGSSGNDTLNGGSTGVDSLFGGSENDTLMFASDNSATGAGPTYFVRAWDGDAAANFSITYTGAYDWTTDLFDGGTETDSLVLTASNDILVLNTDDIVVNGVSQGSNANRLVGLEVILAGVGADIIVMNDANAVTPASGAAYLADITIAGERGADTIVSGSGNDLLVGDNRFGASPTAGDVIFGGNGGDAIWGDNEGEVDGTTGGNDTLYGGLGSDTVYGGGGDDSIYDTSVLPTELNMLYGGDGNDLLFGGAGRDKIFGGAGDDIISNSAGGGSGGIPEAFFGGDGADRIVISLSNYTDAIVISGGKDSASDGDDFVQVFGRYVLVDASLGAGNDTFIGQITDNGVELVDQVAGESGNDAISTWIGADTLVGGSGEDVLWGGAGSDMLFGGDGTDFLYAQEDADTIYGGADWDMIYFGRNDGADGYFDQNDVAGSGARENWIVVYGAFNQSEVGGSADFLLDGAGVRETDHSLLQAVGGANMVGITNSGTDFTLSVATTTTGTSTLTFDSRDVAGIALWDNDHLDGHVIQVYLWNGSTYVYSYSV